MTGERSAVTAYCENNLMLHRTKLANADAFYDKHAGDLLQPIPAQGNTLVMHEFRTSEKSDLVFAGLGWITVPAGMHGRGWATAGVNVLIRKAMI